MFVRQLIGRQAGQIVEMPFAEAKANVDAGTAARVTDDEIQEAGHQAVDSMTEVPPEQLLTGYRIEPSVSGGFDLFDPGGVKVSEEPFHNHIAAREGAIKYARKARGLPDLFDGQDGGGKPADGGEDDGPVDYDSMTVEQMRAISDERKLDSSGARNKKDWVKLLEHDDKVKHAIESGDFDKMTVADLKVYAEEKQIDLTGLASKDEIVDAVKNGSKATA